MGAAYTLHEFNQASISTRYKISCVQALDLQRLVQVYLCSECKQVSFGLTTKSRHRIMSGLAAFVWKMLNNIKLYNLHAEALWAYVPGEWHHWWIDVMRGIWNLDYQGVTLLVPSPIFKDVILQCNDLIHDIKELQLVDLMAMVDRQMNAVVQCPWGYIDYYHKAKHVHIQIIYQRYLGLSLATLGAKRCHMMRSAREDYVTATDWVLLNPEWEIASSIAFIKAHGPVVLVSCNHGNGSNVKYLHPTWHPCGNFAVECSDQMAHPVVVQ